jgi:bacterioferritin
MRIATKQLTPVERTGPAITRERLIELLNEDLAREYQAVISYVVYSQVIKGPQYMTIAAELAKHATEELRHAMTLAKQIDYLGGMPTVRPAPVRISESPEELLRFDLEAENETVRNYKDRVRQAEALGEFALAEHLRKILVDEQEHQIDLAMALGRDVVEMTTPEERV